MVVLANVVKLDGNPYLDLWCGAVERSGAEVRYLTVRALLRQRMRGRVWVHLQWPERCVSPPQAWRRLWLSARLLTAGVVARVLAVPVMVTMHNVWSHESAHPRAERWLWAALHRIVTDVHLLSAAGTDEVLAAHPPLTRARRHVVPHGDFRALVPAPPGRDEARRAIGVDHDEPLIVTFGALKAYKGTGDLLRAWERRSDPDLGLIVAGRVLDPALDEQLERSAQRDARLDVRSGFLSQDDLVDVIAAADAVVLPYRAVLNSSSAMLALAWRRPSSYRGLRRSPSCASGRGPAGCTSSTATSTPMTFGCHRLPPPIRTSRGAPGTWSPSSCARCGRRPPADRLGR